MHDAPWEHFHDVSDPIAGRGDVVVWTTVGFDVGSSTAQVVFSRITLKRREADYVVTSREILHESDVILTPYADAETIDAAALATFAEREYWAAGLTREEIDTGAVILTGLALSKDNSRAVANAVADDSGRFVAVAAGDMMETRLAAAGAGAKALSMGVEGVLVHMDVGGGTTKLSAWRQGRMIGAAALDVGARLVTFAPDNRVTRIEEPAQRVISDLGLKLRLGEPADPLDVARMVGAFARDALRYARILPDAPRGPDLWRTEPLFAPGMDEPVAAVVFTGGVSEYVYGREDRGFGDLGLLLGEVFRKAVTEGSQTRLVPVERGIRATVLGVSQHSVQLSGSTVYVSDPAVLPLRNLPLVTPHLHLDTERLAPEPIRKAIESAWAVRAAGDPDLVAGVAVGWNGSATYERVGALVDALVAALGPKLKPGDPAVVLVDGDVAGVLGARLDDAFGHARPVVCLDSVHIHEFDHVDIGAFARDTGALPVVVKSLMFAGPTRSGAAHGRH